MAYEALLRHTIARRESCMAILDDPWPRGIWFRELARRFVSSWWRYRLDARYL